MDSLPFLVLHGHAFWILSLALLLAAGGALAWRLECRWQRRRSAGPPLPPAQDLPESAEPGATVVVWGVLEGSATCPGFADGKEVAACSAWATPKNGSPAEKAPRVSRSANGLVLRSKDLAIELLGAVEVWQGSQEVLLPGRLGAAPTSLREQLYSASDGPFPLVEGDSVVLRSVKAGDRVRVQGVLRQEMLDEPSGPPYRSERWLLVPPAPPPDQRSLLRLAYEGESVLHAQSWPWIGRGVLSGALVFSLVFLVGGALVAHERAARPVVPTARDKPTGKAAPGNGATRRKRAEKSPPVKNAANRSGGKDKSPTAGQQPGTPGIAEPTQGWPAGLVFAAATPLNRTRALDALYDINRRRISAYSEQHLRNLVTLNELRHRCATSYNLLVSRRRYRWAEQTREDCPTPVPPRDRAEALIGLGRLDRASELLSSHPPDEKAEAIAVVRLLWRDAEVHLLAGRPGAAARAMKEMTRQLQRARKENKGRTAANRRTLIEESLLTQRCVTAAVRARAGKEDALDQLRKLASQSPQISCGLLLSELVGGGERRALLQRLRQYPGAQRDWEQLLLLSAEQGHVSTVVSLVPRNPARLVHSPLHQGAALDLGLRWAALSKLSSVPSPTLAQRQLRAQLAADLSEELVWLGQDGEGLRLGQLAIEELRQLGGGTGGDGAAGTSHLRRARTHQATLAVLLGDLDRAKKLVGSASPGELDSIRAAAGSALLDQGRPDRRRRSFWIHPRPCRQCRVEDLLRDDARVRMTLRALDGKKKVRRGPWYDEARRSAARLVKALRQRRPSLPLALQSRALDLALGTLLERGTSEQPEQRTVELLHATDATVAVSSVVNSKSVRPELLFDGRLDTAWNSRSGELKGAWVGFRVPRVARVETIQLTAGFTARDARGRDLFTMNPRIRKVQLLRDGRSLATVTLDITSRLPQEIPVGQPGGDYIVKVTDVEPGSNRRWRETCISELQVWGTLPGGKVQFSDPLVLIGTLAPKKDINGDDLPPGGVARLGTVRLRAGGLINAVALSRDGRRVAVSSTGESVYLFDTRSGRLVQEVRGAVVAISPDGRTVATSMDLTDELFTVWDLKTGEEVLQVTKTGMEAPPVCSQSMEGSDYEKIPVEDLERSVRTLAYSPDGKVIATLTRWEWVEDCSMMEHCCECSGDEDEMLVKAGETHLQLWDAKTGKKLVHLDLLQGSQWLEWSPDGGHLVLRSEGNNVWLWPVQQQPAIRLAKEARSIDCSSPPLTAAFSADGTQLAVSSEDGKVRLWTVSTGAPALTLDGGKDNPAVSLTYATDGKTLTAWTRSRKLIRWDLSTGQTVEVLDALPLSLDRGRRRSYEDAVPFPHEDPCPEEQGDDELAMLCPYLRLERDRVALSTDGQLLAVEDAPNVVQLLRLEPGSAPAEPDPAAGEGKEADADADADADSAQVKAEIRPVSTPPGHAHHVYTLAISPDGLQVYSGGRDRTIRVWAAETGKQLRRLDSPEVVNALALSADGKILVAGSTDRTVRLWDTDTARRRATLTGHRQAVLDVAISPDGTTIASVSRGAGVRLWEVATGRPARQITLAGARAVTFSPDGKLIAAGNEKEVAIWEEPSGRLVRTWPSGGAVRDLVFSPAGSSLAVVRREGKKVGLIEVGAGPTPVLEFSHSDVVSALAFSGDGRTIAIGGRLTIHLMDLNGYRTIGKLSGHADLVTAVAFTPGGRTLVSSSLDTTLLVWDLSLARRR